MNELKTILDRIKKPLIFAARDNFAHIKSLTGIELFIQAQSKELASISGRGTDIGELVRVFSGFDGLSLDEKRNRIIRAGKIIEQFELTEIKETAPNAAVTPPDVSRDAPGQVNPIPEIRPDMPVQYCKGVGPKRSAMLQKIGIMTVEDALSYLPWRYEDRAHLKKISQLRYGSYETISGEVVSADVVSTKRMRVKVFELVVTDKSGVLIGSWFNQPFMKKAFRAGQKVILSGIIKSNPYKGGLPQIDNPEYEIMDEHESDNLIHAGRIVPIYRATAGFSVRYLRTMMKTIVDSCAQSIPESLPESLIKKYSLISSSEAVSEVHFPTKEKNISVLNQGMSAAHRRLSFEELLALELGLALRKKGVSVTRKGISFKPIGTFESELRKSLPFQLTGAQERVIDEIKRDMMRDRPMNRLVQGDVGSGKTMVAMIASLVAVENGYQACIMAPTEILAEQHYRNMSNLAQPLGVSVRLVVGGARKKEKEERLAEIQSGAAQIVIGTHALIEHDVTFKSLGLVIIDEQHRFGVMQRSTLTAKGYEPDVLVMTATPIPRTLALTVYGDLDISVVDEMPPGRSPIITRLYFERRRREAYTFIEGELKKKHQVYIVYPLVEESEKSDLKAATEMAGHLQKDIFSAWRVGLIHGRMKGEDKEIVMTAFKEGRIHILVSTTVIEVGVDVPNATVMVIEHPERFGLAQLHQLRGRVGRGGHQSFCILMGPRMFAEESKQRLMSFVKTLDGFKIAEEDLRLRGPGEFFGTRQSGLPDLRAANIIRDADLLERARSEAFALIESDPNLSNHHPLRGLLHRKWQGRLGLLFVG